MSQTLATAFEPCFFVNKDLLVHVPDHSHEDILADYLSHRVSRCPEDLFSHVQRIFLAYRHGDSETLYAALLDLFIALGQSGRHLRRRLLIITGRRLPLERRRQLVRVLQDKDAIENLPATPLSRLQQPGRASITLVDCRQASGQAYGLIDEARDLIDSGQLEAARAMLEQAVFDGDEDIAVHEELLALYRHSQNHDAFADALARLGDLPGKVHALWQRQQATLAGDDSGMAAS